MIGRELLNQGYKSYPPGHRPYAGWFYAKKVFDERNTYLYQVEFYGYGNQDQDGKMGWEAEVTLYSKDYDRENGDGWMMLRIIRPKNVAEAEATFANAYKVLECIPDPHNQPERRHEVVR